MFASTPGNGTVLLRAQKLNSPRLQMLFTWDTNNLCIVFRQWHIRSTSSLVLSLVLVVALTAGYEALRAASRRYEAAVNKRLDSLPSTFS